MFSKVKLALQTIFQKINDMLAMATKKELHKECIAVLYIEQ
jgi:hypothetical protein